ncbi:type I-D CRISPR-associated helicase Cas3' [Leptolyngbya ohadii]|uniref:type I-D CRISPR-associated helicase Cas3' n=1 Tax=Leptolyngbya ohadii TaxID=1962290 RepID=UPI000B599337|nr:type I-D CRISPR-associated helicase Cas3' [Leptolyngbya ohadii]
MKILLKPLYSQLNSGLGHCPLGCTQQCRVRKQAPEFASSLDAECPLSSHQAQTYAEVMQGDAEIIFNTSSTGDGKSLAATLPILLNPSLRVISLYPTIELVADQERQIKGDSSKQLLGYCDRFNVAQQVRIDSLYGAELARRVAAAAKGNRFKELLKAIRQQSIILTNPDIFHLMAHFRYQDPAYSRAELPITLTRHLDLYIADEFHIFGVHQEAAILNCLLLIRYNRSKRRRMKFLFTSATPKPSFIQTLKAAGFKVSQVAGNYLSEPAPGFRQIAQPVELEFALLNPETDALAWITEQLEQIQATLSQEGRGRGLIILNSVALVSRVVRLLQTLLPENQVLVREISGRIDRQEREKIQAELANAPQSVLIIATSAVDVGVDFKIHLLIFEASDSATSIQRLGRLGRHAGFSCYKAFVLIPARTPWVIARLKDQLKDGQVISRIRSQFDELDFRTVIEEAFDPPKEFEQYRTCWGALQAQGMLINMSRSRSEAEIMQPLQELLKADLRQVYGEQLDKKRNHWFALSNDPTGTGKAVQRELLRFRGRSDLQAAVWDGSRFYHYDLLKLLPHVEVEVIDRDSFLNAAIQHNHADTEFDDRYIQLYLKVVRWVDQRFSISLECNRSSEKLHPCTLSLIDRISITGHPQVEVSHCIKKQKLLAFLVEVDRHHQSSHWNISNQLHLSPTFGLYRLIDGEGTAYACAFNQDALLLEALKWRIKRCEKSKAFIF